MTDQLIAREQSIKRTEYVRQAIIVNYKSIQRDILLRTGSENDGWFGTLDVASYASLSATDCERELQKLMMQGYLEAMPIRDFPFYIRIAEENPEITIPYGNMYRVNNASWNFEQYIKRREASGIL
jgi:hypothetical protein